MCLCAAHEKCAICVWYFLFRQINAWNLWPSKLFSLFGKGKGYSHATNQKAQPFCLIWLKPFSPQSPLQWNMDEWYLMSSPSPATRVIGLCGHRPYCVPAPNCFWGPWLLQCAQRCAANAHPCPSCLTLDAAPWWASSGVLSGQSVTVWTWEEKGQNIRRCMLQYKARYL